MAGTNHIQDRLREHPECVEIEILGEKRPFLLTLYGLEVAKEKGYEIVPKVLDLGTRIASLLNDESAQDIEVGSPEMADRLKGLVRDEDARTLSVIVWWGLVTFDPDLSLEEVQMMLTPGTLISLVPKIVSRVNKFAEDQLDEDAIGGNGATDPLAESDEDEDGEGDASGNSLSRGSNESVSEADTSRGSTDG